MSVLIVALNSLFLICLFPALLPAHPMMKTPEEQQEKMPQFWSFILPGGHFETARTATEMPERSMEMGQKEKQRKMPEINTSELGRREPDYYDAVREEEEAQQQQKQQEGGGEQPIQRDQPTADDGNGQRRGGGGGRLNGTEDESQLLNMMASLRVNLDPLVAAVALSSPSSSSSPQLPEIDGITGEGRGEKKEPKMMKEKMEMKRMMKPIVFPAQQQNGNGGANANANKEREMTRLDGDTYDDERAEMGKADEEEEEGKEPIGNVGGNGMNMNSSNGTEKKDGGRGETTILELLPEGKQFDEAELRGGRTVVDGQTGNGSEVEEDEDDDGNDDEYPFVPMMAIDGETEGSKMAARMKAKGRESRLPEPPKAKVFGI